MAYPLIIRIVRLAKGQNITSIADFIAARYGKSPAVAATVALIAIVGMIPYIALQLKAVSASVGTILAAARRDGAAQPLLGDVALFVALSMAAFAVLFGTRHIDATEHQDGLMLAIATESIVKLVAFLAVGIFVTFVMFQGPLALFARALQRPQTAAVLTQRTTSRHFFATTVLSLFAIVLLPRQFHVGVVENHSEAEVRRAAWLFPAYLVLINLFVMPIAMAGLLTFPAGRTDGDMFVLALPLPAHSELFALIAFIGGLSAATAMVIVEIGRARDHGVERHRDTADPEAPRRALRRAEQCRRAASDRAADRDLRHPVSCLRLLPLGRRRRSSLRSGSCPLPPSRNSTPAFFGGLIWRRGTAPGAIAGMSAGILVWAYTLLLPSISDAGIVGAASSTTGPAGSLGCGRRRCSVSICRRWCTAWCSALSPMSRFYIGCSLIRRPTAIERVQADVFVPSSLAPIAPSFRLRRASVTIEELIATVARYLGEERTREILRELRRLAPHRASSRRPKPTFSCCNTANICWPRRSAPLRRGWCCRCFCASAPFRPRPRSSCSTMPTRRSTTIARSCRPRSTTSARASRCSTRTSPWSAGTGSSASSSTCRTS